MDAQESFAFDFFISRCGAAGEIAQEVALTLEGAGYRVKSQDFDFARGGDFVADIHDALVEARHLYILHTEAYDQNYWTRKEFTNFLAAAASGDGARRVCVLRCDAAAPRGILANVVFGDIANETDAERRHKIILDVARGEALTKRRDPPVFGGAMPAQIVSFVGREAALGAIKAYFDEGRTVSELRVVALVGMGGVGKTSIARALVDRVASDYSGVWWVAAETRPSLLAGFASLGERLEPRASGETDVETAAVRALRRLEACERPYLIVLDNLDDQSLLEAVSPARGAHLLLTTRRAEWFGRAHEVRLDVMEEDEAIAFLLNRAGRKDEAGARRLAQALGRLPLALDHAGAYVKLTMMSFDAYVKRADALVSRAPKGAPYPQSLAATFSLAIESANRECEEAEAFMKLLAFAAPEDIPLSLCQEAIEEDQLFEAVGALASVSLVQTGAPESEEPTVSVHRLVQSVIRARVAAAGEQQAVFGQALARMQAMFPANSYADTTRWPVCARLLPHALAIAEHARAIAPQDARYLSLADALAEYLHARAAYPTAAALYQDARTAAVALHGEDHPETVRVKTKLGNALRLLGRNLEAEELLRAAAASPAADPSDRAAIMTSLAELLQATNRLEEAETLLRAAIADGEAKFGRVHPDVALRLNNLARVRQLQGAREEAESLFREAIDAGEAHLGRGHPLVGERLNNLGNLYQETGRLSEAEALYREAIANAEAAFDPRSPQLAVRRQNLANLLRDCGRCEEAARLYRDALSALSFALPEGHPWIGRVKYNLACALSAVGGRDEAQDLAREALAAHRAALGAEHPWSQQSLQLVEKFASK